MYRKEFENIINVKGKCHIGILGTCVKVQGAVIYWGKEHTSQPLGQHANGQSQQRVHAHLYEQKDLAWIYTCLAKW